MTQYIPLITLQQGDSLFLDLFVKNKNNAAVDITSATIVYTITPAAGGAAVVTKSVGSGIALTAPTNGECGITTGSEAVAIGRYYHKAVVTIAGVVGTSFYGSLRVK